MTLRDRIDRAQEVAREMPQLEFVTNHHFGAGWYARELYLDAGTFAIGKVHKKEHVFMVTKGSMQIAVEGGAEIVRAPAMMVSLPGTKRAVLALEDTVCVSIHCTANTDLDALEDELIESDQLARFNAHNKLKVLS